MPRPLPDWIHHGVVIGLQGGTSTVQRMHETLRRHDTPIAAFWLQDWIVATTHVNRLAVVGDWEVDDAHYPGWDMLVDDLATDGIRVLTYLNPFLVDASEKGKFNGICMRKQGERVLG